MGKIDFGGERPCEICENHEEDEKCGCLEWIPNPYEKVEDMLYKRRNSFNCIYCGFFYYSQQTLDRHINIKHGSLLHPKLPSL
jgi:hypothetical protein